MIKGISVAVLLATLALPVWAGGMGAPVDEPIVVVVDPADEDPSPADTGEEADGGDLSPVPDAVPYDDEVIMTAIPTGGPAVQRTGGSGHDGNTALRLLMCGEDQRDQHLVLCNSLN